MKAVEQMHQDDKVLFCFCFCIVLLFLKTTKTDSNRFINCRKKVLGRVAPEGHALSIESSLDLHESHSPHPTTQLLRSKLQEFSITGPDPTGSGTRSFLSHARALIDDKLGEAPSA